MISKHCLFPILNTAIHSLRSLVLCFLLFPGVTQAAYWSPISEQYIPDWDSWGENPTVVYTGSVSNESGIYQPVMISAIGAYDRGTFLDLPSSEGGSVIWDFSTILQMQGLQDGQWARVNVSVNLVGQLQGNASANVPDEINDTNAWMGAAYDIAITTSNGTSLHWIEQETLRVDDSNNTHFPGVTVPVNLGGTMIVNEIFENGDTVSIGGLTSAWANASPDWPSGCASAETVVNFYYIVSAQVVPIPSAIWLFGSGLVGLMAVVRRMKS